MPTMTETRLPNLKQFYRLETAVVLTMLIAGMASTFWIARLENIHMRASLLVQTQLAESTVTVKSIRGLTGTATDLTSPDYAEVKEQLRRIHDALPDCRFTYLLGKKSDGTIVFMVDSELPDSQDYSPPGQPFPEVSEACKQVFITGKKITEGPVNDRWGRWISGLVPVIDPQSKQCIAVFGIDVDAKNWNRHIVGHCIAPIAITLLITIMMLAFILVLTHRRTRQEKKQLEASARELRDSEERFRSLLQNVSSVAVQGYNMDGTVHYWNRASEILYGYTAREAIGRNLLDLVIPPEMRPAVTAALKQMGETGQPVPAAELSLMRKDGSRVAVFSSHSIVQVCGRPLELFCIDIDLTERNLVEMARQKLENQFRHAQKMESIGRLAGGVAHDFNNMLNVIIGHAELAEMTLPPDDPVCEDLKEIKQAGQRSAALTQQLLAFARKQTVAPQVLDINLVVTNMLKMLQRLIGEDVELRWNPAAALWKIKMDPTQIDQILANLTVNARDAIVTDDGRITIATGMLKINGSNGRTHPNSVPGDYVVLAVSDNGSGMSQEIQAHIFEPFFTTKESGKGTGLGLATVYGIVTQNHGFIELSSEPGHGTCFKIYLPRAEAETVAPTEPATPDGIPGGTETVLLVEDEPGVLKTCQRQLEQLGYTVLATGSPNQALRILREHPGTIQLLVTDVIMPEMNGRELQKQVTALRPDINYLFMSGYTADTIGAPSIMDESRNFMQKPFSQQELAVKLRSLLD